MPSGSDGSINLDTALDTSGFDAGSEQMLRAAQRLTSKITSQGSTLQQNLKSIMRAAASLGNSLAGLGRSAKLGFSNGRMINRFSLSVD